MTVFVARARFFSVYYRHFRGSGGRRVFCAAAFLFGILPFSVLFPLFLDGLHASNCVDRRYSVRQEYGGALL